MAATSKRLRTKVSTEESTTEEVVTMTPESIEAVAFITPDTVEEGAVKSAPTMVEETTEFVEEVSETAPPIRFEENEEAKAPLERNVKVCLKAKHSCHIGGVTYHFEKDKQVSVPQSVKAILMRADLLKPL